MPLFESKTNSNTDDRKITEELFLQGQSERGGWNRAQLQLLGIDWPPKKGWKKEVIGRSITAEAARMFILLRGKSA